MAASYISALVIKHNNDVYLTEDLVVGSIQPIPTPGAGANLDGDYWAVPISNYGIVSGFNFVPTSPTSTDAPTPQSFHVFRLVSGSNQRVGNDVWYARGTSTFDGESPANPGYIQVAQDAECCAEDPSELPTTVPTLQPCQVACELNAGGNYFFVLGLPTDEGTYTGTGYLNGEALPQITGATGGTLQTQLNAQWQGTGSPTVAIAWTVSENGQILGVITNGTGEDTLCASIVSA